MGHLNNNNYRDHHHHHNHQNTPQSAAVAQIYARLGAKPPFPTGAQPYGHNNNNKNAEELPNLSPNNANHHHRGGHMGGGGMRQHPIQQQPPTALPSLGAGRDCDDGKVGNDNNGDDGGGECSDSNNMAIKMQQAAIARARLAAKNEEYAYNRLWGQGMVM